MTTRYLVLSAAIRFRNDFRLPPTGHINESGKKTGQTVLTLILKRKHPRNKRFGRFICPYPAQSVHALSNL